MYGLYLILKVYAKFKNRCSNLSIYLSLKDKLALKVLHYDYTTLNNDGLIFLHKS